ncbi:MAG: polysaccharide biosynthesis C-terminal domain-containing protein, partial [Lachnospiraceae bacterium]
GLYNRDYDKLNKNIKNYVHLFVTLVCGFLLLSNEVVKVFANDEYWEGMPLVPILVLVVYFTYIYQFAVNYEFFNSKPRIIAIGTGGAALANIMLNVILIPEYGMYGAATATLISYILLACFHLLTVKTWKLERYPLKLKPLFIGLLVVIIFSGVYYVLEDYWILRWGTGILLGIFELFRIWKRKTIF